MVWGQTIWDEFRAAGVTDWRFSLTPEGAEFNDPAMPQSERDKVLAVLAAHDRAAAELAAVTAEEEAAIDADAVAAKQKYASPLLLQGGTYRDKYDDAKAYLSANPATRDADPAVFPYVLAEAAARGVSGEQVAQDIVAQGDFWRRINGRIEAIRVTKKAEVRAASTVEAKRAVRATIQWP